MGAKDEPPKVVAQERLSDDFFKDAFEQERGGGSANPEAAEESFHEAIGDEVEASRGGGVGTSDAEGESGSGDAPGDTAVEPDASLRRELAAAKTAAGGAGVETEAPSATPGELHPSPELSASGAGGFRADDADDPPKTLSE